MPFVVDSFSMVWSQDAWCHVPGRDAVIGECARVLEPGGTIAFADWLLTGSEDQAYRRDVLPSLACPRGKFFSMLYLRLVRSQFPLTPAHSGRDRLSSSRNPLR